MGLLSTPLSVGTKAVRGLMDMSTPARMQRAEDMGFDTNTNWYHGTGNLDKIADEGFNPESTGKGIDQFGSGFYFSNGRVQASGYATDPSFKSAGVVKAHLALKNPLVVDGTKVSNINELPIDLSSDDVRELLEYSTALKRSLDDEQMNPMGDHFSEFWDDGPTDEMMDKLVDTYTNSNLSAIEGDLFDGNATAFREGLAKVTGYDGIVIDFGDGFKNAVAWKPQQVRSTSAKFDPRKANRGDLIASNPVATAAAGAGGLLAMTGSEDSEAGVVSSGAKSIRGLIDMSTPARMARAKEQGFDTDNIIYHATTANFSAFDPKMAGSSTGAKDAAQGMWFADSPQATKYFGGYDDQIPTKEYSDYLTQSGAARDDLRRKLDRKEITSSEYFRKGREITAASPTEPQNKFTEGYESGSQIIPSIVKGRLKEVDASNYSSERFLDIAKSAKSEGYDGVNFNNINDMDEAPIKHSQTLIFDPSNIRSVNAAFDPAKASSSNLLASNPVATTSAGLMANMTGQPSNLASYMQGNTDAYLTAEEREYLNNRQEFDDFFSDDTGYVRADVLPFRTNENTGDSEFATPQMIKGILSSLYDLGQSPRSGIYNQQSILDLI